MPVHEGLAEQTAGPLRGIEGLLDLLRMTAEGLLAEDVLACLDALIDHSTCMVFGSEM